MNTGKCPNPECQRTLGHVAIEKIRVNQGLKRRFNGVSYLCPHCKTIIGVSINPLTVRDEILQELEQASR